MKNLILIIAVVLGTLGTGCMTSRNSITEKTKIIVVDSSGLVENIDAPGTFSKYYDTLNLTITTKYNTKRSKTSYSVSKQ